MFKTLLLEVWSSNTISTMYRLPPLFVGWLFNWKKNGIILRLQESSTPMKMTMRREEIMGNMRSISNYS